MHTSLDLEAQHDLVIYPRIVWAGKKQLVLGIPILLLLIIGCFFLISTGEDVLISWIMILFFTTGIFMFIIQLTWGPFLIANEQGIQIRPNPFFARITLQWDEVASMAPFWGSRDFYFGIALSPAHLDSFLQRQSPRSRKILARRLNRIHLIASFPQRLLPSSLLTLLEDIQEQYYIQIQQHHIIVETQIGPWKRPSRKNTKRPLSKEES